MFALVSHFRSCFHLGPCTRGDRKESNKATCSSIREDVTKWKIQLQLWGVQNKWPHLKQKRPHHTAGNLWTCWSMTYSTTKMINWTDWTVLFCFSKLLSKLLCFVICLWIKTTSRRGFFNIFHIFSQHSRKKLQKCVCVCVLILVLCCFIGGYLDVWSSPASCVVMFLFRNFVSWKVHTTFDSDEDWRDAIVADSAAVFVGGNKWSLISMKRFMVSDSA